MHARGDVCGAWQFPFRDKAQADFEMVRSLGFRPKATVEPIAAPVL